MQAYIAELERENIVAIRATDGIARAHILDKNDLHQEHHTSQVVL